MSMSRGVWVSRASLPRSNGWRGSVSSPKRSSVSALNEGGAASSVLEENVAQDFQFNFYPMRTVDGIIREQSEGRAPDPPKLDAHLPSDPVMWLGARDWVAYDVCGLTRRPLDNALWQADLIFVPRTSELRADKRWAA